MAVHFDNKDRGGAFSPYQKVVSGNRWIKAFGHRYKEQPLPDGIPEPPEPLVIPALIKAYARYQKKLGWTIDARDTYALLSEQPHPNGLGP